jgi:hypothetical protein
MMVEEPESRGTKSMIELWAHIQQRTWIIRRPATSASSSSIWAVQWAQRTRMWGNVPFL